jgi:hypothetical protein
MPLSAAEEFMFRCTTSVEIEAGEARMKSVRAEYLGSYMGSLIMAATWPKSPE